MMNRRLALLSGIALAGALAIAGCASAPPPSKVDLVAALSSGGNNPRFASTGTGNLKADYDPTTRTLNWEVTYTGLSGPAVAAHFHGPSVGGANAPVVIDIGGKGLASPMKGTAQLSEAQAADLTTGKYYVNVHTKAAPGGEIRGTVVRAPK